MAHEGRGSGLTDKISRTHLEIECAGFCVGIEGRVLASLLEKGV